MSAIRLLDIHIIFQFFYDKVHSTKFPRKINWGNLNINAHLPLPFNTPKHLPKLKHDKHINGAVLEIISLNTMLSYKVKGYIIGSK